MQMSSPNILILGHGTHGKDLFAEYLCQELPSLIFISSSRELAEIVYSNPYFLFKYSSAEECYEDRRNHREAWASIVSQYCEEDPAKLSKRILSKSNVYVGMRSNREFEASKKLFDYIFFVDAMKRLNNLTDPSMGIPFNPRTMIRIDNNGSKEDLQAQAKIAAEIIESKTTLVLG